MTEQYLSREERRKKSQPNGKPKTKKKSGGLIKKIFLSVIALGFIGLLVGVGTFAYLIKDAPKLDPKLLKDPIPSKILDKDGNLISEEGSVNREYISYEDIPKLMENAILATEDYRFYQHHGLDPIRLGGAVIANIRDGFGSEGGSTITQQVVKNSFLKREKTIKRKVQEAWLSYQLEQKYTKHQIFEMYVNKVYVSNNSYGIATAAKIYYGKKLDELNLAEAAQLAGMPQSPNNYNPFKRPDLAEKRRNIVLSLMHQHGFITQEQLEEAKQVSVKDSVLSEEKRTVKDKPYDSFVDAVIDEVKAKTDFDLFSDGLTIHTTLDSNAQNYVDKILNTDEIIQYPDEQFQAGIALIDTKTGEIRAIGGGRNQEVKRGFNYAIDSKRQPGSTIKPILDYAPAIEYLNWGTYQMIEDKPITYSSGKKFGNWDDKYKGAMTIRTALQLSRNSPAVQAMQQVGTEKAKEFAINLGIPLKEIYESYAIGGFGGKTVGVSPLEMAGAYAAFGNNGLYTKPHTVVKIELRDGTTIDTAPEPKVVMKDSTAFMITDMLKSVLVSPGTGTRANVPGLAIAGKTGTTNYTAEEKQKWDIRGGAVPDAWFSGYTSNYSASIWTGYSDRKTPIKAEGNNQRIAQLIFKNLMAYVSKDIETPDFKMPNSVQEVRIEKGSMPPALASEHTPDSEILREYAVKGHAPKTQSVKYNKLAAPTKPTVQYDPISSTVSLTWEHKSANQENIQFEIAVTNGTNQQQFTQSENGLMIPVMPGETYTFSIIANSGGNRSDPVSTSIEIPKTNNTTDPGNGNNGNENSNGNGNNDNDNGNGNGNNGNGNGNGNGNNGNGNGNGNGNNGNGNGNGNGNNGNENENGNENDNNENGNGNPNDNDTNEVEEQENDSENPDSNGENSTPNTDTDTVPDSTSDH